MSKFDSSLILESRRGNEKISLYNLLDNVVLAVFKLEN